MRDQHLGELLFSLMTMDVRNTARSVHFTLPESVWEQEREFFASFGFSKVEKAGLQYRLFEEELFCRTPYSVVWDAVLEKLPKLDHIYQIGGYQVKPDVVLSLKPVYAQLILTGRKTVEVRRRFNRKWAGKRAVLYASRPLGALIGEALIADVVSGTPSAIWNEYGKAIGCSIREYENYVTGATEISALILGEILPYISPIPLMQVSHLIKRDVRAPQSYCSVEDSNSWGKAVAIAAMLHGVSHRIQTDHEGTLSHGTNL
ncbi:MAG: hypothetical protein KJ970_03690 [Candidatus Eisenbacteria bacterium]|uniref:ASCH domain-containing protein n=1 Tax=Eiseniibacteriota bacterium TaxID=2212470 RepID=A0A948RXE8_UNCEI|nr:hypothetical protein [Candidatus Eisenbacteria bacterium]MBU1949919.1 hypothetical protein [Candidatus Eisenbacteria bacterium]MBU2690004.1 hypothetical protein [Candidatus Eisenbacteria bacterium]